jgi:hypothetical protein
MTPSVPMSSSISCSLTLPVVSWVVEAVSRTSFQVGLLLSALMVLVFFPLRLDDITGLLRAASPKVLAGLERVARQGPNAYDREQARRVLRKLRRASAP